MSSFMKRLFFFLAIFVLIGVARLLSGQAGLVLTLAGILFLSTSIFYLIGVDYLRARRSREKGASVQRDNVLKSIAEKTARAKKAWRRRR